MKCTEIALTDDEFQPAMDFVRYVCDVSKSQLARAVHAHLRRPTGISLLAYDGIDLPLRTDFRWAPPYCGGKALHECHSSDPVLFTDSPIVALNRFFREFLARKESRLVLLDDNLGMLIQNELTRVVSPQRVQVGDDWYFFLTHASTHFDLVDDVIRSSGISDICFLAVCSRLSFSLDDSVTSLDFFERLVHRAEHVIVEVYDGEGYLILHHTSS